MTFNQRDRLRALVDEALILSDELHEVDVAIRLDGARVALAEAEARYRCSVTSELILSYANATTAAMSPIVQRTTLVKMSQR